MAAAADARAELAAAAAEKKQIQERREAAERDRAAAEEPASVRPGRRRGRTAAPWRMPGTRRRPPPTSSPATACGWRNGRRRPLPPRSGGSS